jgi:large subunit ribosomal protein L5
MAYLAEKFKKEAVPAMMKKFGYKSSMQVPKIEKVVLNTGFGRAVAALRTADEQKKVYVGIIEDLGFISGQKPVLTVAKKSISSFKIRKGLAVGASVTLRKQKMEDFLERLIQITLPRSRDFQGIDRKFFDKRGNLTLGMKEHISFPEVSPERSKGIFGLEITVVTNAKSKEEGIEVLKLMGFPIK